MVVYNKFNFPFYNLLQSKNLFKARKYADLREHGNIILDQLYVEELRGVNINDKEFIINGLKTEDIEIEELFEINENSRTISEGLRYNQRNGKEHFLDSTKFLIHAILELITDSGQDASTILRVKSSLEKKCGSMNLWRIKNIYFRMKLLHNAIRK